MTLLVQYLNRIVSHEQADAIQDVVDTLSNIYTDFEMAINNYLSQVNEMETTQAISQLYDLLIYYLDETLSKFGVVINTEEVTDIDVYGLHDLLRGLLELEAYEDVDTILSIIDESDDTAQTLYSIINTITDENYEYHNYVSKVSDSLIDNIQQVYQERQRDESIEEVLPELSDSLKRFISLGYTKYVNPYILETLSGKPHTLSLRNILRLHGNRLADDKNGQYSWVYVLLISEPPNNLSTLYEYWSRYFLEDVDLLDMKQKIESLYRDLFGEATTHET